VETPQRHCTNLLVVTEKGTNEAGEVLAREWIAEDNKATPGKQKPPLA
jgi:hypothetical protein